MTEILNCSIFTPKCKIYHQNEVFIHQNVEIIHQNVELVKVQKIPFAFLSQQDSVPRATPSSERRSPSLARSPESLNDQMFIQASSPESFM